MTAWSLENRYGQSNQRDAMTLKILVSIQFSFINIIPFRIKSDRDRLQGGGGCVDGDSLCVFFIYI